MPFDRKRKYVELDDLQSSSLPSLPSTPPPPLLLAGAAASSSSPFPPEPVSKKRLVDLSDSLNSLSLSSNYYHQDTLPNDSPSAPIETDIEDVIVTEGASSIPRQLPPTCSMSRIMEILANNESFSNSDKRKYQFTFSSPKPTTASNTDVTITDIELDDASEIDSETTIPTISEINRNILPNPQWIKLLRQYMGIPTNKLALIPAKQARAETVLAPILQQIFSKLNEKSDKDQDQTLEEEEENGMVIEELPTDEMLIDL